MNKPFLLFTILIILTATCSESDNKMITKKPNKKAPFTLHTLDDFNQSVDEAPYYHIIGPYKKLNFSIFFIYGKNQKKLRSNQVLLHEVHFNHGLDDNFSIDLVEEKKSVKIKIIERFDNALVDSHSIIGSAFVINGKIKSIFIFYNDDLLKKHFQALLDHYSHLAALNYKQSFHYKQPSIDELRNLMKKHKINGVSK